VAAEQPALQSESSRRLSGQSLHKHIIVRIQALKVTGKIGGDPRERVRQLFRGFLVILRAGVFSVFPQG
jgi:hypothetical protein